MAPSDLPPSRPRRERPLVAPGRERPPDFPPPAPWAPPVVAPDWRDPTLRADHVEVTFTGPTPQRRSTVAFRIILAVPHLLWAGLLGYGHGAVAFVAWFAALFTGQVPAGMTRFLIQVVQYQARVHAYSYLLMTDEYPSFALDAADYAVNVRASPGRFNPAAVLFRLVLMAPSMVLSWLLLVGAQVVGLVGWLLTLILGRLPTPLWEANAAVLRYLVRTMAFASLLTAEQPGGALGDRPATPDAGSPVAPALPDRPRIGRLVLTTTARRLVVLFGVVTVFTYGSFIALAAVTTVKLSAAYEALDHSHDRLDAAVETFDGAVASCPVAGRPACLRDPSERLADAFERFADDVEAIDFGFTVNAEILVPDAQRCAASLRRMSAAPERAQFDYAYDRYRRDFANFRQDYRLVVFDTDTTY